MAKLTPRLSIIIPAFNEETFIGPCLESIHHQTIAPDEVIVVDNNSTDRTPKIARSYPFVTLIHEKKQGMIPARNAGFNAAHGALLARIDADTRLPERWVSQVHNLCDYRANSIFGISGPQYFYEIHNRFIRYMMSVILSRFGYFILSRLLLGHETLFGSNMIISQKAWLEVRSEVCSDSRQVHEDIDLAIHIGEHGTIAYDDRLIVGVSSRPLYEGPKKTLWRLKTWVNTITRHRKLFVGTGTIQA